MLRITLLLALAALSCQAAPTTDKEAADQLYRSVIVGDYDSAVAQSKELEENRRGSVITQAVDKLIDEGRPNTVNYAYQLWNRGSQDIVKNFLPLQFRTIFSQLSAKVISRRDGMPLKLQLKIDSEGDRTAYGHGGTKDIGTRVAWKFIPLEESESKVYFKIYNVKENQFLKLGTNADSEGDHSVYGSTSSETIRHQWYLQPVLYNKEILFYIFNREYPQALKLARALDTENDRQAYGHNGVVIGSPELYGWDITPY